MKRILATATILFFCLKSFSQQVTTEHQSGIKFNFNPEGTKFLRAAMWNQIWFRDSEMNPGTMINGEASSHNSDLSNRRLRILLYSQFSKRYMVAMHMGINNQNFTNGGAAGSGGTGGYGTGKKPGLFFHDAWNEYALILPEESDFTLSLGAGLHSYMGLSRMTMTSTLNLLTLDAPGFNWPTLEVSDQLGRQLGIFAKGKYKKFEYRMSINKPFATSLTPQDFSSSDNAIAVDNNGNVKWSKAGYFEYQFFDIEQSPMPYRVGNYLGTKKVFNLGAGFYHAPLATKSSVNGIIKKHDMKLFAADAFFDMPIGNRDNKMALSAYSVFYNYNFGPNYLRNTGVMNVGISNPDYLGTPSLAGAGNLQPNIGTGNIWYTQAGFLLPSFSEKPIARIQPFGAYTYKNFEALNKPSSQFDVGANFFLEGHHAKITTQYSTRPVYTSADVVDGLRGEFIVQLQVYL